MIVQHKKKKCGMFSYATQHQTALFLFILCRTSLHCETNHPHCSHSLSGPPENRPHPHRISSPLSPCFWVATSSCSPS